MMARMHFGSLLLPLAVVLSRAMPTPLTHEEISAALIDDALCTSEHGQESCGLALVQRWAAQRSLEASRAATKQQKMWKGPKPEENEQVLEDKLSEAETKVNIDKMEGEAVDAKADVVIGHFEDKLREAKSEQKVAKLKKQVKEAEDKKNLDKLEGKLGKVKSGDKPATSQVKKDAASVKELKEDLQDAETAAEKQKLNHEMKENEAAASVDELKRDVKKAKIEAKSEKLADKVAETEPEDDYAEDDFDFGDDDEVKDAKERESSVSAESPAERVDDWKKQLEDDLSDPDAERAASGEEGAAEEALEDDTGMDWDEAPPPAEVDPAPTVEPIEPTDPELLPADAAPTAGAGQPGAALEKVAWRR